MPVKHMRLKGTMSVECLPTHHASHPCIFFRHVSNMIPLRVEYDVPIRLFKATVDKSVPALALRLHSNYRKTYIIIFIISSCLWTTNAEFAKSPAAGCRSLSTAFGSSGMCTGARRLLSWALASRRAFDSVSSVDGSARDVTPGSFALASFWGVGFC